MTSESSFNKKTSKAEVEDRVIDRARIAKDVEQEFEGGALDYDELIGDIEDEGIDIEEGAIDYHEMLSDVENERAKEIEDLLRERDRQIQSFDGSIEPNPENIEPDSWDEVDRLSDISGLSPEEEEAAHQAYYDHASYELTDEDRQATIEEALAWMKGVEKVYLERDRIMAEPFDEQEEGMEFPEIEEEPSKKPKEEKPPEGERVPASIVGRLFTIRRKDWKGKIWEATPGGARSKDGELRPMTEKLIEAIVDSRGFVVLSGRDYMVVVPRSEEGKLIEEWRGYKDERK